MSEQKFIGGPKRTLAYKKLKVFLSNPGKFCLMVIGARGAGKHFAIEKAHNELKGTVPKELCLQGLNFITADKLPRLDKEIDSFLKRHSYKTLVIEDVERLTLEQQQLMFTILSTEDGRFGLKQKFNLRFVFTSSRDVEALREDENLLQGIFWDRISQLIVELPSYKTEPENILRDFYSTWVKMKFEKTTGYQHFAPLPKNRWLEKFLEDDAEKFDGCFRDLDKLACMYFNYRILHYEQGRKINESVERKIVENIKEDFIGKSQLHSAAANDLSIFQIRPGLTMSDLNGQFKIQVREWGKREYGTIAKAEEKLDLGKGTMKNWTEQKVTRDRRGKH